MGKRKELNMENWIGVCEYDREQKDSIEWLIKLLEEEKIPLIVIILLIINETIGFVQ